MAPATDPDVLLLQAAADPARLAILRRLSSDDEVCACDFTDCCGLRQPTISHHLKVLRDAGWVTSERRGTWVWYTLRPEAVNRFRAFTAELGGSAPAVGADVRERTSRAGARRLPVVQPLA